MGHIYFTLSSSVHKLIRRPFSRKSGFSLLGYDENFISVKFDEKEPTHFRNVFLRDACQGLASVDPHSKQKLFSTSQISPGLSLNRVPSIVMDAQLNQKLLQVEWKQNGSLHVSKYSESFLRKYSKEALIREGKFFDKEYWNKSVIMMNLDKLQVDYGEYFVQKCFYEQVVKKLNDFGIVFVNNIPDPLSYDLKELKEDEYRKWPVAKLAEMFGYVKKTFYGTLFDVKNETEAKNIANTTTFLPLHMDLLYYESPPGVQLLHFIQNSTLGGENVFSDSYLAAQYVKEVDEHAFEALKRVPITYHYENANEFYYFSRPLIVEELLELGPTIKEVNYSPPFQGPFEFAVTKNNETDKLFGDFLRGFKLFEDFVNDPNNQLKLKMKEGSCVIFDNRRILHSRENFSDDNGGRRWLMGCYVDGDSFRSKIRMGYKQIMH
ncbi:uncharacterized protein PRCAT00000088001 [Priceomyces carsonii]|uniref:uncharacterized protein n=1 Tax=Priceomyces carsonii TaxID=28549 RepID=UPI002ED8DA52|nr:unnamed protein product [Priceomyces carsonii]